MRDNKMLNVGLVKFICVMHSLNKRIITKHLWAVTVPLVGRIIYCNGLPLNNQESDGLCIAPLSWKLVVIY